MDIIGQFASLIINQIMIYSYGFLFNCMTVGQALDSMKKVNKQCLLDTPRTVRDSEKTWQVIVQTSRIKF